jgi:hypothetical protein
MKEVSVMAVATRNVARVVSGVPNHGKMMPVSGVSDWHRFAYDN